MEKFSHLSTLIERIKRMEGLDDFEEDPLFKGRLLNLVEYMTYSSDWTDEEGKEAKQLLDKYDFDVDFNHKSIEAAHVRMRGLPDLYRESCVRCGRHLSNKYSIRKGMGPVCRQKAEQGDWGSDYNVPEPGKVKVQSLLGGW